jgi:hypothetical protein
LERLRTKIGRKLFECCGIGLHEQATRVQGANLDA